jgi:hypothetical protein
VFAPVAGDHVKFLRGDATWATPPSPSDFVASGASHAAGLVPDPGAVAGTSKFLREDATWQTVSYPPAFNNTTSGLVPVPSPAGGSAKFLREDATWTTPTATTLGPLNSPSANLVEQVNGANAQTFNIYSYYTDANNWRALTLSASGSEARVKGQALAGGSPQGTNLYLEATSSGNIYFWWL